MDKSVTGFLSKISRGKYSTVRIGIPLRPSIELRPDGVYINRVTISDNRWNKVYERSYWMVDSVTIHNNSGQTVYYAFVKNPSTSNYEELPAKSKESFTVNPSEIYVKRSSSTSQPEIVVTVLYYSDEYLSMFNIV